MTTLPVQRCYQQTSGDVVCIVGSLHGGVVLRNLSAQRTFYVDWEHFNALYGTGHLEMFDEEGAEERVKARRKEKRT